MVDLFDLQMFADGGGDGGAGAGEGSGAPAAAASESAENVPLARGKRKENPLANVTYGKQPQAQAQEAPVNAAVQQQNGESFEDLIKGRYKADYDARVQATIQERFKANKAREEAVNPILQALAEKYGMDASDVSKLDLNALTQKLTDDNSIYEQEALEKGLPVETVKKLKKLEKMEAQKRQQREQSEREAQVHQHLEGLMQQAEELKQLYPSFDLEREMKNPEFVRLTAPGVGVNVRTAYEVIHRDEMRGAEMQFAARKSAERISASVAANARRPAENGLNGSVGAVNKSDPRTLTPADRAEIRRRVARGEKIVF